MSSPPDSFKQQQQHHDINKAIHRITRRMERRQSVRINRDTSRTPEQQRTRNNDGVRSSLSLRRPSGRQRPDRHLHNIRNQFYHRDRSPKINNNNMRHSEKFFELTTI